MTPDLARKRAEEIGMWLVDKVTAGPDELLKAGELSYPEQAAEKILALAADVAEACVGEDLPPCWAHDSRDDGEDYEGIDGVEVAGHKHYPCGTNEEAEQFNIRLAEQRRAASLYREASK